MGKRRTHIITDLNDSRLFPDEVKEEGEALDFSLTLTQASSLYIICNAAIPTLQAQLTTAKRKMENMGHLHDEQETVNLNDTIYVLKEVLEDAQTIKEEVASMINELN